MAVVRRTLADTQQAFDSVAGGYDRANAEFGSLGPVLLRNRLPEAA